MIWLKHWFKKNRKLLDGLDMQNVGIPLEAMFGGGRGGEVAYTYLIPVLTSNFDENALLGHICWGDPS